MELTVSFGWWVLPAGVSLLSLVFIVCWKGFLADAGDNIGARAVSGLLDLIVILALLILSLIVWLIWALVG